MLPSKKLERLLRTTAGIERIVNERWKEEDNLDFKREVNRRDKDKWQADLRVDCAALASIGVGFLVVGVDEDRDGQNRAKAICPVPDPVDTKRAIEHTLADGLSPPLKAWEVWTVETTQGHVIVVRVEGTRGYPVEVIEPPPKKQRYYLRGAAHNKPLSAEDARLRRRAFDVERERNRVLRISALPVLVAIGVAVFAFDSFRSYREEVLAVDSDMCGYVRDEGGLILTYDEIFNLKIEADAAIWKKDSQACWRLHEKLIGSHPQHPWRYFWAGQCSLLSGDTKAADAQFALSEQTTERAGKIRPGCVQFKLLRALNAHARKREVEACKILNDLHAGGLTASRDFYPPMQRLSVSCEGGMDVLAKLGLAISAVDLEGITGQWPVEESKGSRVLMRAGEMNNYDIQVCSKAYPVDLDSVTLLFDIAIAQSGAVLKAGPSPDVGSSATPGWEFLRCVGRMVLDWKYPPHALPSIITIRAKP
ncbi:helix-turn-helix domain-containing protein [Myxococcus xanthus]|uniref:AlbA family DNA-binding domain-containing protein n=1 Tax=Myxococcus xanthus TaxID=34 RepID=UPI00112B05F4|nr:ATP-binding protein [Myxococcus xanthus]